MGAGIELRGLKFAYANVQAIADLSLKIKSGEFFTILGPSGCGKTTLLRLISGFIRQHDGSVLVDGKDMAGLKPAQRPSVMVFQNLALFPLMRVWQNVAFGLEAKRFGRAEAREKALELLRLVGLGDVADRFVFSLSGGQKQRVAIARALAVEPKVLLLDEPLSALDLKTRQQLRTDLREIQRRTKVTFLYITHDQGEALAVSDRIGVMNGGRILQVGTPKDLYEKPATTFVASFIGENNLFKGEVIRGGRLATDVGTFNLPAGARVKANDKAFLMVRPEHVTLQKGPGRGNSIQAVVHGLAYEGATAMTYLRDKSGRMLKARALSPGSFPVGTKVYFAFSANKARVLPVAG